MVGEDCEIIQKLEEIPWVRSQEQFARLAYAKLRKHCKEVSTTFEDEDIYVTCKTYDNTELTFLVTTKLRPRFRSKRMLGKLYDVLKDFDSYEIVDGLDIKHLNETINTTLQSMELPYRVNFKIYDDAEDLGMVLVKLQNVPISGYIVFRNVMFTGELWIYDLNKDTERVVTIPIEFASHDVSFIGDEPVIYERSDDE
jgi:hypothetical protein